jgi:predicted ester cyclase
VHTGEFAAVPATGKEVDVPLAIFYTVDERGITEGRVWFMVSSFLQQVSG